MSTAVLSNELRLNSVAGTALRSAAGFWFLVAVIGQWAFLHYIVAFYGPSTFRGNFQAWTKNTFLLKGYVPGDTAGNLAFAAHALLAGVIAFGGAIQLVPQIRTRAIAVHRWIGRVFFVTALGLSGSGLYMEWVRGARSNISAKVPAGSAWLEAYLSSMPSMSASGVYIAFWKSQTVNVLGGLLTLDLVATARATARRTSGLVRVWLTKAYQRTAPPIQHTKIGQAGSPELFKS
jgi:hypothetical protein